LLFIKVVILNFKLNVEQFSENENTCDIFINEVRMENEPLQKPEKNASV
jgi:hypothetical protein